MQPRRRKLALGALVLAVVGAIGLAVLGVNGIKRDGPVGPGAPVGLVTSLPIYWPESAGIGDLANPDLSLPWTRVAIERDYALRPLDALAFVEEEADEPLPGLEPPPEALTTLADLERLAIIQPRGLSPQDNVALDEWVQAGGRLLLVLDPMLTGHYDVSVFDPRHPVGSALIPPVVERWGLEVRFDDTQAVEPRILDARHGELPVMLAGELALREAGTNKCVLDASSVVAHCRIGQGRVTVVADAALFEAEEPGEDGARLLRALLRSAFE